MAKVIVCRLQTVILKLINPDQTGFMPGRCAQINIRLFVNVQTLH